jgi:hypothetical protein
MSRRITSMQVRRPVATVLLASHLAACFSYQTSDAAPQEAIAGQRRVIVHTTGEVVRLEEPWLVADTIGGTWCDESFSCRPEKTVMIPTTDVRSIETYRLDVTPTVLIVTGVGLVAIGGVVVLSEVSKIGS